MLASGAVLSAAGGLAILVLPLTWQLRLALVASWSFFAGAELWHHHRRYRRVSSYRLYGDGSVDIEAPDGTQEAAEMAAGSVGLAGLAWLRCRAADGRLFTELVGKNSQERDDWRRFRVICRHVRAC